MMRPTGQHPLNPAAPPPVNPAPGQPAPSPTYGSMHDWRDARPDPRAMFPGMTAATATPDMRDQFHQALMGWRDARPQQMGFHRPDMMLAALNPPPVQQPPMSQPIQGVGGSAPGFQRPF
jgi:hypothetical protein